MVTGSCDMDEDPCADGIHVNSKYQAPLIGEIPITIPKQVSWVIEGLIIGDGMEHGTRLLKFNG